MGTTTKHPRVKDLVPFDKDLPPAAAVMKFCTYYSNHQDLKLAACQAKLMPEMGEKLYRNKKVREIIDRKMLLVDVESAKLKAQAARLTVDKMDAALYEEIHSKKNGHVRVKAIELGYRRAGLIRDGEFYVAPNPDANNNAPSIYMAQQTTVRQTTTTEVTHTAAQLAPPPTHHDPIFVVQEY